MKQCNYTQKIKHYLDAENDWEQIKIIIYKMLGVDEMETI